MTSGDERCGVVPVPMWGWVGAFVAYFGAAALGLLLAFPGTNATPFWPPTAVALTLLFRFGLPMRLVIFASAFAINFIFLLRAAVPLFPSIVASACVGVGNMLEAWVGVWLIRRIAGSQFPFDGLRGLAGTFTAAVLAPGVSATIGVTCSRWADMGGSATYLQNWLTWWVGDASGTLTMAPILMHLLCTGWRLPERSRRLEAAALLVALVLGTMTALGMWLGHGEHHYSLAFLLLPIILWAALRFHSAGAASAVFVISIIAVLGSLAGTGPFVRGNVNESLLSLQVFIIVVAGTTLSLGAALTERARLIARLAQSNAELNELATNDPLTGLPNRRSLVGRIQETVRSARRFGRRAALLFLDLDRFKRINDSLGHAVGDELLRAVARRLRHILREVDMVCRLGGDEFVLLAEIDEVTDAGLVARKVIEILSAPMRLAALDLTISTSVGISIIPDDGGDADHLIRCADMAMYRAKKRGRGGFQYYEESMHRAAVARLMHEHELRVAFEARQFCLYYQPVVDLRTRAIAGIEALLRWRHPQRGLLPPSEFIALAEETGLIIDLGSWALRAACADAKHLRDAGVRPLRLSINMSLHQLRDRKLPQVIEMALAQAQLDTLWLGIEITEGLLDEDLLVALDFLNPLGRAGIALSIDNFDTAGPSFSLIARLPVDVIKIDRKLIARLPDDKMARDITLALIAMVRELGVRVVAEGVETQAQCDFLAANSCDYAQGFWFHRPQPLRELQVLLTSEVQAP